VLLYLLLNRPEVIFFSRIGFVAWYPPLSGHGADIGINPWYALLACFSSALADRIFMRSLLCRSAVRLMRRMLFVTARQRTCCAVRSKLTLGCDDDEMWSATFW